MTVLPIPSLVFQPLRRDSASGLMLPLPGGKLYTYVAGTLIPQAVYKDAALTVPHTNPVILDADGKAQIYLSNAGYKFLLTDAAGVTVDPYPIDGINTSSVSNILSNVTSFTATAGQTAFTGLPAYVIGTNAVSVYLNGSRLSKSDFIETDAATITLVNGTQAGDIVDIISATGASGVTAPVDQNLMSSHAWTGLTTVGVDSSTYNYQRIGNVVHFAIRLQYGTSSASAGGTTTYMDLPPEIQQADSSVGISSAVDGTTMANLGNSAIINNKVYVPAWTARSLVIITGHYTV